MLLDYLSSRLNLSNPVPVSWAVGIGSQEGGGVDFCGGWVQSTVHWRKTGVWLGRPVATLAVCQNHQGSILRNSQSLPS